MERHFALPITITAALHAGLLFGIHPTPSPPLGSAPDRRSSLESLPPIEVDLAPPATTSDHAAPAKGAPDTVRPDSPEPPVVDSKSPFVIEMPDTPRLRPDHAIDVIDGRPPGVTTGRDDGGRTRPVAVFTGGELDSPPRVRLQVPPQYPPEPRRNGTPGEVFVEFVVDESGAVLSPRVVRSSDRAFDEPTLRAVARWRFEPGRRDGRVVRFRLAVPVIFTLDRDWRGGG